MFARLAFVNIQSGRQDELKRIFNEEVVPMVKSQKGNLGIWLLEPTNEDDDYVSLSEWLSKQDADAYEASDAYRALADKVKDIYKSRPVLKTYNVAESKIVVTM